MMKRRSELLTAEHWQYWAEGASVPQSALKQWAASSHPPFHCSFCNYHGILSDFKPEGVFACPKCREYKGVEPCIPNYCQGGETQYIQTLAHDFVSRPGRIMGSFGV